MLVAQGLSNGDQRDMIRKLQSLKSQTHHANLGLMRMPARGH